YTDENRRFQYLLAKASGKAELEEIFGQIHDRLARFMVLRHAGDVQAESHARIVAALRARDPAAARQALLAEITETRQTILDRLMQDEGASWEIRAR
ncbi:MAG: FCD domain-containing protein, partial [Anaerolineae bacterium]